MTKIHKGIYAGFVATIALSVLVVLKSMLYMLPNMNVIKLLVGMAPRGWQGLQMDLLR